MSKRRRFWAECASWLLAVLGAIVGALGFCLFLFLHVGENLGRVSGGASHDALTVLTGVSLSLLVTSAVLRILANRGSGE